MAVSRGTTRAVNVELVALAAMVLGGVTLTLWLGRHLWFFYDELSFFEPAYRPVALADFFRQWNSHWSTSLYAVYAALDAAFGHRFYLPYQVTLLALHGLAVAMLYAIIRPRATRAVAFGVAALMLFLGSAAEDIFWAWQIGYIGSTAFGLLGLFSMMRGRPAIAAVSLLVAVTFSGMGLPFVAATTVLALQARPRSALWLVVPVGAFIIWRALFAAGPSPDVSASQVTAASVALYATGWTVDAIGAVFGLGIPGALALIATVPVALRHRRMSPLAIAAVAGLLAEFILVAVARSGSPYDIHTRYIYPAAALILVAASELFAEVGHPPRRLIIGALLAAALVVNAVFFVAGPYRWADNRYQLTEAFGCYPLAVLRDAEGPRMIAPEGRCPS